MIKNYIILTSCIFLFTGCASSIEEKKETTLFEKTHYTCENEKKLEVVYLTTEENGRHARVQLENTQYVLENVPSGSGAKYSNGEYTWWTKGSSGFLENDGVIILRNCVSRGKDDGDNRYQPAT